MPNERRGNQELLVEQYDESGQNNLLVNTFQDVLGDLALPTLEILFEEWSELNYHTNFIRLEMETVVTRAWNIVKLLNKC